MVFKVSEKMQHARIYNRSQSKKSNGSNANLDNNSRIQPSTPTNSIPSVSNQRSISTTSNQRQPPKLNSMSSNQASLVVGSIRSRSSSLQTKSPLLKTLNTKNSDNTIVVGRHFDRNSEFDRSSNFSYMKEIKPPPSNHDSFDTTRDPTLPTQLTVWFHELRNFDKDFMIDLNAIPGLKVGDIIEVEPVSNTSASHSDSTNGPNQSSLQPNNNIGSGSGAGGTPTGSMFLNNSNNNTTNTPNSNIHTGNNPSGKPPKAPKIHNKILFLIKDDNVLPNSTPATSNHNSNLTPITSNNPLSTNSTPGTPNLGAQSSTPQSQSKAKSQVQLSLISNPLQKVLDLLPRSLVQVHKIIDVESIEADTIEISIKNVNLSRDSMWVLTSELINSCVFAGKRIAFLNNRSGFIKNIYKNGRNHFSGYIGKNTKIVYRSESAKLVFLIQTSREMWHFEESGEIMFHKLVNNLFPKIFRNWRERDAHHTITIVLFTSVDLTDIPWTAIGHGERPNKVREYFRVVVDQVNIFHWSTIMENLRLEFVNFKRDIMLNRVKDSGTYSMDGVSLPAVKGNILEAINMGLSLTKDRFTDTDLKHCLTHFIVITPGTGLFDVDYNLLVETSKKMSSTDCALDLICLSQPPLHIVPLFRYKDLSMNGKLTHCIPNWCDISFYKDPSLNKDQWIPRCKIYELQMMGLMENEVNDIEIERLRVLQNKDFVDFMDKYDDDVFRPTSKRKETIEFKDPHNKDSFASSRDGETNTLKSQKYNTARDSLMLMYKSSNLKNQPSSSKLNISTNNATALGTVTNPQINSSALSSLYQLKGTDGTTSPTLRPQLTSSNTSVKSLATPSNRRTLRRNSPSMEKMSPKVIKNEDIFKPKEISQMTRANIERSDVSLKRSAQQSTTSLELESKGPTNYFWTEISNPSKELHVDALSFIRYGKWSQVFPPNIKRNLVKWRSFQSPASLPIYQSMFPTKKELDTQYTIQIYSVLLNPENDLELMTSDDLMREMIQLRLLLGFQICDSERVRKIEAERNPGGNAEALIKYLPTGSYFGLRIYMMLDNEIHRIVGDGSTITVQLYRRIEDQKYSPMFKSQGFNFEEHRPLIRTRYADEFTTANVNFLNQGPHKYNWNQFDQLIAGYDDALPGEKKSFFRMKFVVMPADIPKNAFYISNESLTDEEIRVEGLRKLISLIEKGLHVYPNSPDAKAKRETIEPEISFYTGNLYEFLSERAESYDLHGEKEKNNLLLATSERFDKSIKLTVLASELQSPNGVAIVDRTWHFATHQNCFIGNEFVSWLVENFEDINTREEATAFGQSLMDKELFKHVENRHGFLDGYYFYELELNYIDKTYRGEKSSGWFSRKKNYKKETTPTSKNNSDVESNKSPSFSPQEPNDLRRIASIGGQLNDSETSSMAESSGSRSKSKRKFVLSRSVKYNADPLKKSYKPETIIVHYDKVHNPEHCFHIRLQWLNTSTRFIDETINNWVRVCERHGLKFVETPWKELCTLPDVSPFHSFVDLKLSINPWEDPEFCVSKILNGNRFYYHLFLLAKSGFLLDNRSAVYFLKENIEISYSWGKPSFKYAQFIHKTGSYIVEVRDNGDFFLAPNNMHITRINAPVSSNNELDPNINSYTIDSQKVMLGLRNTCTNRNLLANVFREAKKEWREDYLKDILPTDI